uniref:CHK kinase-like domain-containing protein n=1 Tax=Cacopsylla melanoneura TaxID=428564 RepID=A0A8D8USH5_9HEMI
MGSNNTNEDPYLRALNHITTQVVPKIHEHYEQSCIGNSDRILGNVQFVVDESRKGKDQFQSVNIFGTIVYEYETKVDAPLREDLDSRENQQGVTKARSVVESKRIEASKQIVTESKRVIIKMQLGNESSLKWNNGGVQFFNEVTLYKDFLPYFSKVVPDIQDVFPEYVYGFIPTTDNRLEDIIILEDLCQEEYQLAASKTALSLEHILLALTSLGRFHACSYIMKTIDKENFLKKINSIKLTRAWIENTSDPFQDYVAITGLRGLKYLERIPEYKDKLKNVRHFLENIGESLPRVFQVSDRTSVLCHGDFCRNNMFFKYESQSANDDQTVTPSDATPISVKLFDLATIMYASPVHDIAFFLYLNTTQEQRVQHWHTMIRTYYESLKQTCNSYEQNSELSGDSKANSGNTKVIAVPTYEEIQAEFKLNSMMGYLTCSYFLPMMMQPNAEIIDYEQMPRDELMDYVFSIGGEEATKAVGEILRHVVDNGFM